MTSKAPFAQCSSCTLIMEPFVPPSGDLGAPLVIVGEAPGAVEVEQQKPFVGQSGQLLDAVLAQAGADPENTYRTNAVMCRPPGNRAPDQTELACCNPRLVHELLATHAPILLLGKTACESLSVDFGRKGAWLKWRERWVKPAWHPAYVLREPDEATIFIKEVTAAVLGPEHIREFEPKVVVAESVEHLRTLLEACPDKAWVAFDIETDQIQWYDSLTKSRDAILMLQIAWNYDFGIVVGDELLYDEPGTVEVLRKFFDRVQTCGHNAKFDNVFLRSHIDLKIHLDFDTLLAIYILDETMPRGLKILASLEFGIVDYEPELLGQYLSSRNDRYSKVPFDKLALYGCKDVCVTLALRELYEARLKESGQYDMPFQQIIMPATRMLEDVELRGFQVDTEALDKVDMEFRVRIDERAEVIRQISGHPDLNPNAPAQLAVVLFDELHLPMPRSYKIKPRSTNNDVLEKLKGQHPIIKAIKEYRRVKKLHSSYVDNVRELMDKEGRVHGSFLIYGTEVGRLSVRDPALQTISRPDDTELNEGGRIRGMYVAKPGCVLVVGDFSQAELRVMAVRSQESFLLQVYRDNRDLHTEVALAMYGPNFTKNQRVMCKMFNFSYAYGGSEYSFAEDAGLDIEIARAFVRDYNKNMPQLQVYKRAQYETLSAQGFVETIFRRRRHFPFIVDANVKEARKSCVHMDIASTASDLTLMSCVQLASEGVPIVLSVHDSILAEVPEEEAEAVGVRMREVMTGMGEKYLPEVPWKVDVEIRERWYGGSYRTLEGAEYETHS